MLCAAGMDIFQSEMIGIEASNHAPVLARPATSIPLDPKKLADVKRPSFAETLHHSTSQSAGDRGGDDSDNHQRQSNHSLTPAVAINRIKRPHAKNIVREIGEKLDCGQSPKFVMRTQ